jgi:hypothetical protein
MQQSQVNAKPMTLICIIKFGGLKTTFPFNMILIKTLFYSELHSCLNISWKFLKSCSTTVHKECAMTWSWYLKYVQKRPLQADKPFCLFSKLNELMSIWSCSCKQSEKACLLCNILTCLLNQQFTTILLSKGTTERSMNDELKNICSSHSLIQGIYS